MTRFYLGATSVDFERDPFRPGGQTPGRFQNFGRSSSGDPYVYEKSRKSRILHRLPFKRLEPATLAALRSFMTDTVQGIRKTFTWTDQDDVDRTVRFTEPRLRYQESGGGKFDIEIILEEVK